MAVTQDLLLVLLTRLDAATGSPQLQAYPFAKPSLLLRLQGATLLLLRLQGATPLLLCLQGATPLLLRSQGATPLLLHLQGATALLLHLQAATALLPHLQAATVLLPQLQAATRLQAFARARSCRRPQRGPPGAERLPHTNPQENQECAVTRRKWLRRRLGETAA